MNPPALIAPGPRGDWLLGNVREFRRDALGLLAKSAREFGDVVRFRLGHHVVHLVNHPDHIEHVLLKNHQNYERSARSAEKIRGVCGESLLTSSGEAWRKQRRLMQPAFHQGRIAGFAAIMAESTTSVLDRWADFARSGRAFDLASEMSRLTFIITAKALLNADASADAEIAERALPVVLEHTYHRLEKLFDPPASLPLPANRRFRKALEALDQVVFRIIAERRQRSGGPDDLLSMLLDARDEETGQSMTDDQLRNESIALLLAGHETTANALSWMFYLISQAPSIEADLCAELSAVLGGRAPMLEDIPRLKLTTMVVNESLRLYPSIWALERRVLADDVIGGFHIPAGSTIVISPFVLHRHPAFWEEPEIFRPARFTDTTDASRLSRAYLPFGAGAHQCIGSGFAMMEARIILSMAAQRYRLRLLPGHPVEPKPGITLRPRYGLMMTAQRASKDEQPLVQR